MMRRASLFSGALAAFGALLVYWLTLYPGLVGPGDTAKFQYLGRVLGTAHNPGYPLFVVVSWAFSYVPIGDLAFRMNLFAAVSSAATAVVMVRLLARCHVSLLVAVATALTMAYGRMFWGLSIRAEVYAFAALLQVTLLFFLVRWHETQRRRDLYFAAATIALALGHHLTVVMLLPAIGVYLLMVDRREVTRPRTFITMAVIVCAGFLQYLFIVVRTLQGTPALESHARDIGDLVDVIRGRQFEALLLEAASWGTVLQRAHVLAAAIFREFGWLAGAALAIGAVDLARRRRALLVLFAGGAAGVFGFVCAYAVPDFEGFLIPVVVSLWPVAGIGLERCRAWLVRPAVARAAVNCGVCLLPALALYGNYRINDHSRRTFEIEYFRALFDFLPDRSAIIGENYHADQLVRYKLLGERAAGSRDIRYVPTPEPTAVRALLRDGRQVFLFEQTRNALRTHGFQFEPVSLVDRSGGRDRPIVMEYLPLFHVVAFDACTDVGNVGWTDVTDVFAAGQGIARSRTDNFRPFDSTVTLLLATDSAEAPRVFGQGGSGTAIVSIAPMSVEAAVADVPAMAAALAGSGTSAWRVSVAVNDDGQFATFRIDARARPLAAFVNARVDLDNPRRATTCSDSTQAIAVFRTPQEQAMAIPLGEAGDPFFGNGWHPSDQGADRVDYRWTSSLAATILVGLPAPMPLRLEVDADALTDPAGTPGRVYVSVNGVRLEERAMGDGPQQYVWEIPAAPWLAGPNELTLHTSRVLRPIDLGRGQDTRTLGLAVTRLELRR